MTRTIKLINFDVNFLSPIEDLIRKKFFHASNLKYFEKFLQKFKTFKFIKSSSCQKTQKWPKYLRRRAERLNYIVVKKFICTSITLERLTCELEL